jgi:hypothetical protein
MLQCPRWRTIASRGTHRSAMSAPLPDWSSRTARCGSSERPKLAGCGVLSRDERTTRVRPIAADRTPMVGLTHQTCRLIALRCAAIVDPETTTARPETGRSEKRQAAIRMSACAGQPLRRARQRTRRATVSSVTCSPIAIAPTPRWTRRCRRLAAHPQRLVHGTVDGTSPGYAPQVTSASRSSTSA